MTRLRYAAVAAAVSIFAARAAGAAAGDGMEVKVTNFPLTQNIKGTVTVDGIVRHGRSSKVEGLQVQPSRREDAYGTSSAGVLETEGFTRVTLSLEGEIKSTNFSAGTIGVLLIPDEEPILKAFRERGQLQFPLEATAVIRTGDSDYFSGGQVEQHVAFGRYRIYLYNTVNRPVEANVYFYLSN